jgi:homoserine O-acetyltransferase
MLGEGKCYDTSKYFVVCCNILGSCYGSTSPRSVNPDTGEEYGNSFPAVSVRDTAALQMKCLESLGVSSIKAVVGGSFGGMQVLETLFHQDILPVRSAVPIACGVKHTAWQIGISEVQRQAIYADPRWNNGDCLGVTDLKGLDVARQIGMVTYRTAKAYSVKFDRTVADNGEFDVKNYLEYQGKKFLDRFDPITYVKMTEQMDTHDVGRGRGGVDAALSTIDVPTLVIGIDSDVLYPIHEQEELYEKLGSKKKEFVEIRSDAGHDGFLLEQDAVGEAVTRFLDGIE